MLELSFIVLGQVFRCAATGVLYFARVLAFCAAVPVYFARCWSARTRKEEPYAQE